MTSKYVLQEAASSRCPSCRQTVALLCRRDANFHYPSFYICFRCQQVAQVGRGPVPRDQAVPIRRSSHAL